MANPNDRNLAVEIFKCNNPESLQDEVNKFLQTLSAEQIKDIKFSSTGNEESNRVYNAMVIYEIL